MPSFLKQIRARFKAGMKTSTYRKKGFSERDWRESKKIFRGYRACLFYGMRELDFCRGSTLVFGAVLLLAAFLPLATLAQGEGWQGLVTCGKGTQPCQFNDLLKLANTIIDFLFRFIVLPLVAVGVLASGITILTAAGSESQIKKGRDMLWNIIIGFLIAAIAWVAVNTVLGELVRPECNFLENAVGACYNQ